MNNAKNQKTMANFKDYEPKLRKWEGHGFKVDPDDYGGATNGGVTLKTFRLVFGEDKTVEDLRNMTDPQWRKIMKGQFWDKCGADELSNQSVAELFVDWCIHAGIGKIKMVQAMVEVETDGIVGKKTIAAINNYPQEVLHRKIKLMRAQRFLDQIYGNSRQMKYFNGWFNRIIDFNYRAS